MNQTAIYGISLLVGVVIVGGGLGWLFRIQRQINAEQRAAAQAATTPPARRTLPRIVYSPQIRTEVIALLLDAGYDAGEIAVQLRGAPQWNRRRVRSVQRQRAAASAVDTPQTTRDHDRVRRIIAQDGAEVMGNALTRRPVEAPRTDGAVRRVVEARG